MDGNDTPTKIIMFDLLQSSPSYHVCECSLWGKAPNALNEVSIAVLVTCYPSASKPNSLMSANVSGSSVLVRNST